MRYRFFDILFSGLALLLLSPFLLPVMIFLRLTGEGEVFYLQERIGLGGRIFRLYKFATMLKNSPSMPLGTITVKDDPRILPLGNFLRKSKLNELPQLLNVFFGDMSIVGPRPLTLSSFNSYPHEIQGFVKSVLPGLSGIGSIVFRGEEDILGDHIYPIEFYNSVIAPYKGLIEVWFVKNRNIRIYFLIIFVTSWVVVFSRSTLVWRAFRDLPQPPPELIAVLRFPCGP